MKPWVTTTPGHAASWRCSAVSGANSQVADRKLARAEAAARVCALRPLRASHQLASIPCALRKRAPSSVAISSPLASTRARVRSLTSLISAMPDAI